MGDFVTNPDRYVTPINATQAGAETAQALMDLKAAAGSGGVTGWNGQLEVVCYSKPEGGSWLQAYWILTYENGVLKSVVQDLG
jgi:hypothetical protein